jgi:hypothetical protein
MDQQTMNTENAERVAEYIVTYCGFQRIFKHSSNDEIDIDKFTFMKRIGDVTYLFYSESYRYFTIATKHEKPKGNPGSSKDWTYPQKFNLYTKVMIPRLIQTPADAKAVIDGVSQRR